MTKEEMLEETRMLIEYNFWTEQAYKQGLAHRPEEYDFNIETIFGVLYELLTTENIASERITYWYGRIMNPNRSDVCGGPR